MQCAGDDFIVYEFKSDAKQSDAMFEQDTQKRKERRDHMYRSNSSLELVYAEHAVPPSLRREYGSHGSIDVIGGASAVGEKVFTMVHTYNHSVNQSLTTPHFVRPTPVSAIKPNANTDNFSSLESVDGPIGKQQNIASSPKLRLKFHKFWGSAQSNVAKGPLDDSIVSMSSVSENFGNLETEEQQKRRSFAHYDCQSLVANLGYAAALRGMLLSRRRNTTTGASAASLLQSSSRAPPADANTQLSSDPGTDIGDGRCNDLVDSCPFFRNEIGGEEERCISLSWRTSRLKRLDKNYQSSSWHRPATAYGLSVLEFPVGQSHWKQNCPYSHKASFGLLPIESQDMGALYYRKYFYGQDHQNWFGMDEHLGPVAISIKKERVELSGDNKSLMSIQSGHLAWQYRLIIRTAELFTLRGSVLEEAIANIKPSNNSKNYNTKDVFEYVAPEVQQSCLRLGIVNGGAEEQLLRLDEQCVTRHYKVGVMYCRKDQATEEEMYNNQEAGPAFIEFLQSLGQTVRLKGFDKYKAGLDNKSDSTGLYSVYATYQDCEIMFHVSTMLPYTPNNRQQLLRKRHIGNDIVTIVFQEPGAQPFTPKNIRSQFQHVFITVRAINPCTENTHYSIAVSRSKEVPLFGPPIREGATYPKGESFTDLLLSKVINGENAAIQSPKFSTMATRTRQEYLKDLAKNYVNATCLDTGQKFSLFSSLLSKGGSQSTHLVPSRPVELSSGMDAAVGGALCWLVTVQDEGSGGTPCDCFLGLSADTLVIIEEITRQIIFVMPTRSLLGWVVCGGGWLRVYHHRGECVGVRARVHADKLLQRLASVAPAGAGPAPEATLHRNNNGQLGFHVQPDGLVTAVEAGGAASRAGLRRGARLLEVCRAAVATLAHDQMVDLLKTSEPVTVCAVAPAAGADSAGCSECGMAQEGEEAGPAGIGGGAQQLPGRQRRRYDRNFSPPRSSDSSGYGTGGSGRSARRSPEALISECAYQPAPSVTSVTPTAAAVSRRHSHDGAAAAAAACNSPRRNNRRNNNGGASSRPQSGAGSLQEELMRLIDPESIGVGAGAGVVTKARPALVASPPLVPPAPPSLPLPDARSLDWPALVDTATRAMLQICEEHQYPSMDNNSSESTLGSQDIVPMEANNQEPWRDSQVWSAGGSAGAVSEAESCACGLGARVAALEACAARGADARRALEEEVRRLRRHNARLRDESARAVRQLRRFTEWFMQTVDRQ